jgi:hypothetical protein
MAILHGIKKGMCRRICKAGAALLFLMTSSGCIYSLHPWHSGLMTDDPALHGSWQERDGQDLWIFSPAADSLLLMVRSGNRCGSLGAGAFQLDGQRYLDLLPAEDPAGAGLLQAHFLPLHGIFRYRLDADTLFISSLDIEDLDKAFSRGECGQATEVDDRWIMLGDTAELDSLLRTSFASPEFWDESEVLERSR